VPLRVVPVLRTSERVGCVRMERICWRRALWCHFSFSRFCAFVILCLREYLLIGTAKAYYAYCPMLCASEQRSRWRVSLARDVSHSCVSRLSGAERVDRRVLCSVVWVRWAIDCERLSLSRESRERIKRESSHLREVRNNLPANTIQVSYWERTAVKIKTKAAFFLSYWIEFIYFDYPIAACNYWNP
jgi:hypothetical protein